MTVPLYAIDDIQTRSSDGKKVKFKSGLEDCYRAILEAFLRAFCTMDIGEPKGVPKTFLELVWGT